MKRLATLLVLLLAAPAAWAQDQIPTPTVRQINALPSETLTTLNTAGADLTETQLEELVSNTPFAGQEVEITVVLLTTPRTSGLANITRDLDGDGTNESPSRIHVFVRDTSAATNGARGNDIQIVDGNYETTGILNTSRGDVVTMRGTVEYFGETIQFAPANEAGSVAFEGRFDEFGYDESLLDPITVQVSDINRELADGSIQVNWDNFSDLNSAYVRIEGATTIASGENTRGGGRPSYIVTQNGGETWLQQRDTGLCFRNDRAGDYPDSYLDACDAVGGPDPRDSTIVPPALGAIVNLQGHLTFAGGSQFADFSASPEGAHLQINPFVGEDLEITALPNVQQISVATPQAIIGDETASIVADIEAIDGTIQSVEASFITASDDTPQSLTVTDNGDGTYTASLPAQTDGEFVTVQFDVTDTDGLTFRGTDYPGGTVTFRVLYDGIDDIEDIQRTAGGVEGASPFDGIDTDLDLEVTVQNRPGLFGSEVATDQFLTFVNVQDGTDPFSGVFLSFENASDTTGLDLRPGTQLSITSGRILEASDEFSTRDGTYLLVGTGDFSVTGQGDPFDYVTLTTGDVDEDDEAEAYEGMNVRFEDVTVTEILRFGEFSFATEGTDESVRADDLSSEVPGDFAETRLEADQTLDFIQGVWYFSFGDFKLAPSELSDINDALPTSLGDAVAPGVATLMGAAPNPVSGRADVRFELVQGGHVTLDVYDALGRKVATLVDGVRAAGAQSADLDASGLSAGVYFVRLTTDSAALTRSLTVLR